MATIQKQLVLSPDQNFYRLQNTSVVDNHIINRIVPHSGVHDGYEITLLLEGFSGAKALAVSDRLVGATASNLHMNYNFPSSGLPEPISGVGLASHVVVAKPRLDLATTDIRSSFDVDVSPADTASITDLIEHTIYEFAPLSINRSGIIEVIYNGVINITATGGNVKVVVRLYINGIEREVVSITALGSGGLNYRTPIFLHRIHTYDAGTNVKITVERDNAGVGISAVENYLTIHSDSFRYNNGGDIFLPPYRDTNSYGTKAMIKFMWDNNDSVWIESSRTVMDS